MTTPNLQSVTCNIIPFSGPHVDLETGGGKAMLLRSVG
jgi:hypothetical protein